MGRHKKGFNWKARQVVETQIDNSLTSKIKVELPGKEKYDESNLLVLPSRKRETKKKKKIEGGTKILSKTQRKRLEKIIEKKKKKENRSELLEKLSQVQATPEQLRQLSSIAAVQTKGLKRVLTETDESRGKVATQDSVTVNSLQGSRKRRRLLALEESSKTNQTNDPNVVGFEQSSSSDEEAVSEDEEETNKEIEDETGVSSLVDDSVIKAETQEVEQPTETEEMEIVTVDKTKEEKKHVEKKEVRPAVYVPVDRYADVQEARLKLPILAEEQTLMEVINDNPIVIIAGETGSGKTTQVPQFLYEAGYARDGKMIAITEPRRVAAISMSKRVAYEMNLTEKTISYLIRFEGNCTPDTKIKFMTDGVLLKEIQSDFLLEKYSVVILDEAHERSIFTDILIGLLSRIVPLRQKRNNPLKLLIMSATLRIEDFTENKRLFKTPPPVVKVESRQFPVTIHFNKVTKSDYLRESYNKTCKIHTKLPPGGILVFVTGQQEVNTLVRKLKKTFPYNANVEQEEEGENDLELTLNKLKKRRKSGRMVKLPDIDLDKYSVTPEDDTEGDLLEEEEVEGDISSDDELNMSEDMITTKEPMWVLPLYSLLPTYQQSKVFEAPPPDCRLCVVSTNVAETSLTIPHIRYVVDCGKTKARVYDKVTGVSAFEVVWCSKAGANQRAGRAGRIGPGHCYRLYSSAVFNDQFPQFSVPEIQQKPVDDLVLQMKSMNIVKVVNFPFPTSPDLLQLKTAERRLGILGALDESNRKDVWSSKLSKLGETMSCFPVSPRFAKMLALSCQHDILQYTLCIVSALSVQQLLLDDVNNKWSVMRRNWAGYGNSLLLGDPMVLLRAVGAAEYSSDKLEAFCEKNGLRHKAVVEVRKLRIQLTNQISLNIPAIDLMVDPNMKPPTDTQARLLRQIMLAGMADQIAHRIDDENLKDGEDKSKMKRAYRCCEMEEPVFLHRHSVLSKSLPKWVVYQEVYETNKLYMRGVTAVEPEWLPVFVPSLCNLSEPLEDPPPRFDEDTGQVYCHINGTFGKAGFSLPTMEIPYITGINSYKWFATFMLQGVVCRQLKKYRKSLLSSPEAMTKSWAKFQPRTESLLQTLVQKDVNTRTKLLDVWKQDSSYLLSEYKLWLPESAHAEIIVLWPPV